MKLKKLLFGLPFLLCINTLSAQSSCACNCIGQKMPHMILTDYDLSSGREANFRNIKRKFLKSDFAQEFPLKLDDLMQVFANAIADNASGLRIYFAQETIRPGELSLVFVPTKVPSSAHPNWYVDQETAYQKIEYKSKEARLVHLDYPGTILGNFRNWFKKKSEADSVITANHHSETISLFYSKDSIMKLYDAINTGCLKGIVQGVGVKFVAYKADEKIPDPENPTKSKLVGNQLLIHFVFYDCNSMPIDFLECYGHPFVGDADTGLPCPDFCSGGVRHPKK